MNIDVFNEIDQIINIDVMGRKNRELYRSARKSIPLCLEAAKIMINSIEKDGTVIITSGFPIIPNRKPETDGPIGAIILARAVESLDAKPLFLIDDLSLNVHTTLAETVGIKSVEIRTVPIDSAEAKELCHSILLDYKPCFLISIEKPGINQNGIYCNMNGDDVSPYVGKVDHIFIEAMNEKIPTIGIGDGGNEIGMGNIFKAVTDVIPFGHRITSTTRVTSLVIGGVSNWGAYGIVAALSILVGSQLVHRAELEREMIETCIKSGAIDGISKKAQCSVDGLPSNFHEHLVEILHYITEEGISRK